MTAPFVAVIMPLSGYDPGVPPRPSPGPGLPGYPAQGLPVYPSQQPLPTFGGGYPSHGLPGQGGVPSHPIVLPPPGQPGSPEHPIKPVDPGTGAPVSPPLYIVVPGYGVVGPIYLAPPTEAEPKA